MGATHYDRVRHAAHYAYSAGGHDLERWSFASIENRRPVSIPADAEYHSGYRDADGVQHWVYVRRAPLSAGACERCAKEVR